ncbi:hypothetical protein Pdw03_0149 [Penicillium digitatum]|uniref:Uncharacterized protein n=1 Tax=Penicillium digitatum TaxID=36651 RepID=A0A7T6XQ95_PENDI|nr:hypothetical protein Pdw03_0149 [Penicillium digitatum]
MKISLSPLCQFPSLDLPDLQLGQNSLGIAFGTLHTARTYCYHSKPSSEARKLGVWVLYSVYYACLYTVNVNYCKPRNGRASG